MSPAPEERQGGGTAAPSSDEWSSEEAIKSACASRVQAAFDMLVAGVMKKDAQSLKAFADSVILLEMVRDQAIKALSIRRGILTPHPPEHPADILARHLNEVDHDRSL